MKIGLTGGIGCGKSTVVGLFAEAGWSTLQADLIVRDLLDHDDSVRAALHEQWGEDIFRGDGTIDRKVIAKRVFGSKVELAWLESLLHPKVRNVWETKIAGAFDEYWVVEIPLLFEKKLETRFDFVICVEVAPKIADKRMLQRGFSPDEIKQRRERQMPLEEKICRSDYVISNAGSLGFLELQVKQLIKQIEQLD